MQADRLTETLKLQARRLGFSLVGICPAQRPPHWEAFEHWVQAGYAGQMHYFHRRVAAYEHPQAILEGVRSLVMLGMPYRTEEPAIAGPGQGRISRYAWGADYHELIRDRLRRLAGWLLQQVPTARVRGVVDTAPLLERSFAQQAGLGWIGKNTLLIHPRLGSYLFLAALLTDLPLEYDRPLERSYCGRCRACVEACPTGALLGPYVLDARRCISYLTIELRQMPAAEVRPKIGDWLFGCDRCQEVCPWNRPQRNTEKLAATPASAQSESSPVGNSLPIEPEEFQRGKALLNGLWEPASRWEESAFRPKPGHNPVDVVELFYFTEAEFRERFRHTALWRAKRAGLLRNAALVLGNRRCAEGLAALSRGLQDPEPIVRAASAWALGQYPETAAHRLLEQARRTETTPEVQHEITTALQGR